MRQMGRHKQGGKSMNERQKREHKEYIRTETIGIFVMLGIIAIGCVLVHSMWELGCSL